MPNYNVRHHETLAPESGDQKWYVYDSDGHETGPYTRPDANARASSLNACTDRIKKHGKKQQMIDLEKGDCLGRVEQADTYYAIQDIGLNCVIHDQLNLSRELAEGENARIRYKNGVGHIIEQQVGGQEPKGR